MQICDSFWFIVQSAFNIWCLWIQVAGQQGEWLAQLFNSHHIGSSNVLTNGALIISHLAMLQTSQTQSKAGGCLS